jgi:hypothetical protein
MRSTVPCAGETIALGILGAEGLGSRKKKSVKMANKIQTTTRIVETVAINAPRTVANTPMAKMAPSRIKVQKMIFRPARIDFPECLTANNVVGLLPIGKADRQIVIDADDGSADSSSGIDPVPERNRR